MSDKLHNELKREFQLERMILFSDAVFAIAITLLVIEIKVPEIEHSIVNDNLILGALAHLIPKFVGFIVSFLIIGIYWSVHHRIFGFVTNYDNKLVVLNLLFLFGVALMPFSTAFYSEYVIRRMITPVVFYVCNITLLGVSNFFIWRHISNPKLKMSENVYPLFRKYLSIRALMVPAIFTLMAFLYILDPKVAVYVPILIPLTMRVLLRKMKKRVEAEKEHFSNLAKQSVMEETPA